MEKYGKEPNTVHIGSYDAARILAQALEQCPNHEAQCMLDDATSLKDYNGAGGPMTFNKEMWGFDKPFVLKTVQNGTYKNV